MVKRRLKPSSLATLEACATFLRLLDAAKDMDKKGLVEVLKKNKDVSMQLIDVLGAAGTLDAHQAAIEYSKASEKATERYLWSLAQAPEPRNDVVRGEGTCLPWVPMLFPTRASFQIYTK
jgi:hypothetical protein